MNDSRDVASHLQSALRHARHLPAGPRVEEIGCVSNHKHVRVPTDRAVRPHLYTSAGTQFHTETLYKGRRAHTRRPDNVVAARPARPDYSVPTIAMRRTGLSKGMVISPWGMFQRRRRRRGFPARRQAIFSPFRQVWRNRPNRPDQSRTCDRLGHPVRCRYPPSDG
jgi:hypothetical protein